MPDHALTALALLCVAGWAAAAWWWLRYLDAEAAREECSMELMREAARADICASRAAEAADAPATCPQRGCPLRRAMLERRRPTAAEQH